MKISRNEIVTDMRIVICLCIMLLIGLAGCQTNYVKDIEGNKYRTVTIGTQIWMAENLKTTRYNDGTLIPHVTKNDNWAALTSPAYCWYNNDSTNQEEYGALYNWYTVNTDKLCPEGWHVPTDEEWNILMSNFGDSGIAGGALKETGTLHWKSPNTGATNESGFTALPGGYRSYKGTCNLLRAYGFWWSSTASAWYNTRDNPPTTVIFRSMRYKTSNLFRHISEQSNGFCVRCIMDQKVTAEDPGT